MTSSDNKLPLSGLRVVNFGREWLGPVAGQTLAFLGAEVYRVESQVRVDINRTLPPFGGGVRDHNHSLQNHAGWAGNGSITLNLKEPKAVELAKELVAKSDVAIENFGPGVMEKLGLGYEVLRQDKSDVILVSMPAAGLTGALKNVRTYGMSLSSITGLDSLTGYADGPPVPMENAYADPLGGIIGAFAVLLGVSYRTRTGKGQHVDFSQQEGIMQMVTPAFMDYVLNGRVAGPIGNRHPLGAAAPHGVFPCAGEDRWISIAVSDAEEWEGLVAAMGTPEWSRDQAFVSLEARVKNIDALHEKLAAWTSNFDDVVLADRLQAQGVAAAPVLNVADLLNSPQYKSRKTFIEVDHPLGFRETIYGAYVKTSRSNIEVKPGPVMGRDNGHVFQDLLGLSEEAIQELIEAKVIF
jgi:benzylsuccinate CoA-transferase BbsF subunit